MGNGKWFRRGGRRAKGGAQQSGQSAKRKGWLSSAANRCALSFEALEDRNMLAVFLVNNPGDLNTAGNVVLGTLRWAINQANATGGSDTIVFADNVSFISLDPRENGRTLNITEPLSILGPGPRKLTVSGTGGHRVFNLDSGTEQQIRSMEISGMTITNGSAIGENEAGKGGAVFNREGLRMTEVVIQGNSAQVGGGGVYTAFGSLTLDRSLVIGNSAGGDDEDGGGGGILNGRREAMNTPTTTITNTTITNNSAGLWGGGVLNRNGRLNLEHVTITENFSGDLGDGVASWGNGVGPAPTDPPADPPPDHPNPTVFTTVYGSIIHGNGGPMGSDVDRVGETDEDPPRQLNPSITSRGYNIVGTGNATVVDMELPDPPEPTPADDFAFDQPGDQVIIDPMIKIFRTDPDTGFPLGLQDFGGSTDAYLLDDTSPALDAGDEFYFGQYEQRGRHFTRIFDHDGDDLAVVDIGAVEMQAGEFVVDTLFDEENLSFSFIFSVEFQQGIPLFTLGGYEVPGNFSIREALDFASKNPGLDTIFFSDDLNSDAILDEEDINASPAPTIVLSRGELLIDEDLIIQGPEGFILEIDAVGNDTSPTQNGTGTRVVTIDDGDTGGYSTVLISNLTFMGGDVDGRGGGILTREDLSLSRVTFKGNNATDDGGGLHVLGGATVTVDRTTFSNNRAGDNGGGVSVVGASDLTMTNSTLSANLAGNRGGGMVVDGSHALIEYSTLTLNNASSTIGSAIVAQGASPSVELRSTIASGNVAKDLDFFGAGNTAAVFASLGWNFIGRGNAIGSFTPAKNDVTFNSHGALATDPKLEPLSDTGGFVQTHAPKYRPDLGIVSPVIDMGDPNAAAGLGGVPDFDQRGFDFSRVVDGLPDGVARIDIGAYELQERTFLVSSFADENDGIHTSGNLSLREAIELANLNPLLDTIEFDPMFFDGIENPTISLGGFLAPGTPADLRITTSMIINWTFAEPLTIDGAGLDNPSALIDGSRMFTVDDGIASTKLDVEFRGGDGGLVFRNALAPQGGGVMYSRENLTVSDATFINNRTFDFNEAAVGLPVVDLTGLHGGAIYQDGTGQATKPTLLVERVLFTGNLTQDVNADGGAIYAIDAAVILNESTVAGNATTMASGDGGGIALKNSTLTSSFSTITGNIAQGSTADGGGVHFVDGSVVTLNDTVVSGNHTNGGNSEGGGLAGVNSHLIANRSFINENFTMGSQASGGGLALTGGTATLDATSVDFNVVSGSNSHGGGIWNNGGVLTVRGSSIVRNQANHATSKGGGIYSDTNLGAQSTTIINSTVSGNSAASRGGGVFNADGRVDIKHSTITNNSTPATGAGSGVASFGNSLTTLTSVKNSIIAGNVGVAGGTRTDLDFVDGAGNSFQSLGYNVIGVGNGLSKFDQPGDETGVLNPGLAPLANNGVPGGVTFEMLTHALLLGSIAIDAGDPTAVAGSGGVPQRDQRGASRVRQGRIDVGAFEFPSGILADFDGDADSDGNDFLIWQRNLGTTPATKAQGDADDNDVVNGMDLAIWREDFGSGGSAASAAAAASASVSGTAFASAEVQSAPAESDQQTIGNSFASLASLGVPGSSASSATTAKVSDSPETFEAAAEGFSAPTLAWESASGDSLLDDEDGFASLVEATEGGSEGVAEDAVFASWGVGRLF